MCEAAPVYYRLPAEKDFAFDIEEFKSAITPKTKVAVVISPSNPTGKIFTEENLRQIADALKDTGIYLISDEIYSDLYFGDAKPHSASEFYDKTIIVSGLSKSLSDDRLARRLVGEFADGNRPRRACSARFFDRLHFDDFAKSEFTRLDGGSGKS